MPVRPDLIFIEIPPQGMSSPQALASAFRCSSLAAIIVDIDAPRWTIIDANDCYVSVTRHPREELIGRGTFDAFPESAGTTAESGEHRVRWSFEQAPLRVSDESIN